VERDDAASYSERAAAQRPVVTGESLLPRLLRKG
jgi:hypothetical protein